ncbi:PPE family protein (plasmid) [Mycobacterium sp. smrl_JER01]|nr:MULTISPECIES: PPE family protein [unclassified Mycobacterium]UXA15723.1 PPE family protein [Mycobacterium sp. SMC-8]UXA21153.1 PPE family protein [Mycobacterium sp. SMC-4]
MPPGAYQAEPPETTSAGFWLGPSAASFFASAAQLEALAGAIIGMLGGHAAVEAAMSVSWPSATGEIARLAHVPHLVWLGTVATMLNHASASIMATGDAFETLRAATPNPGEVVGNQSEHMALVGANFLGMLTPLIVANRGQYTEMWMRGSANKSAYEAASLAGVQAIPPIPPPPPSTVGAAGGGSQPGAQSADPSQMMETATGLFPQLLSMPTQALSAFSGGGPLKSITELPQQAFGQLSSLASSLNVSPDDLGADFSAGDADWVTQTPQAGGAVAASLGGAGGGGGMGGAMSAASALRSPGSWASSVSAATPVSADSGSRIEQVRSGTTMPASMGGGGMMGPMAHGAAAAGAANQQDSEKKQVDGATVMAAASNLYTGTDSIPVITGGGGLLTASAGGKGVP